MVNPKVSADVTITSKTWSRQPKERVLHGTRSQDRSRMGPLRGAAARRRLLRNRGNNPQASPGEKRVPLLLAKSRRKYNTPARRPSNKMFVRASILGVAFHFAPHALDQGLERHGAQVALLAVPHRDGARFHLFPADHQHVRDFLHLGLANFVADLFV